MRRAAAERIYLDYAATTPVAPEVVAAMQRCLSADGVFANPASIGHPWGRAAQREVARSQEVVAGLIAAPPESLVWTSGATESINMAILGRVRFAMARGRGRHVITGATEHSATIGACRQLEREGAEVTYLAPDAGGRIQPEAVSRALREDTVLVSLMHVNNETGVVQDVERIAAILATHPADFHVDAAQSAAYLPIDVAWGIDLLSLSAHKFYGPKGIGALYVRHRPRLRLEPLLYGGGQQRGLRPGTLPVHQIVGMAEAALLVSARRAQDMQALEALSRRLLAGLQALGGITVNGVAPRAPHIVNISFAGVHGESLALALDGLGLSLGSACTSASATPSHVLRAMGVADDSALASFRFSLGRGVTADAIDHVLARIAGELPEQRRRMGAWCTGGTETGLPKAAHGRMDGAP